MFNLFWQEKLDNDKKVLQKQEAIDKKKKDNNFLDKLNNLDKYNNRVKNFTYEVSKFYDLHK